MWQSTCKKWKNENPSPIFKFVIQDEVFISFSLVLSLLWSFFRWLCSFFWKMKKKKRFTCSLISAWVFYQFCWNLEGTFLMDIWNSSDGKISEFWIQLSCSSCKNWHFLHFSQLSHRPFWTSTFYWKTLLKIPIHWKYICQVSSKLIKNSPTHAWVNTIRFTHIWNCIFKASSNPWNHSATLLHFVKVITTLY